MIKGLIECLRFFLFIELIFIFIGGSVELLFSESNAGYHNPNILTTLGFLVAGIAIGIVIFWRFPLIFKKCKYWVQLAKRNVLQFFVIFFSICLLFSFIIYLGESTGLVIPIAETNNGISIKTLGSLFIITLAIGFTEEFIYRGVFFAYFFEKIGIKPAIILVSLLFSLGHFYYLGLLPFISAFNLGIVSTLLLLKTGSLYGSIGLHTGWNFIYFFFEKLYILNAIVVPIWGNLFELFQTGVLLIILISLLFVKKGFMLGEDKSILS